TAHGRDVDLQLLLRYRRIGDVVEMHVHRQVLGLRLVLVALIDVDRFLLRRGMALDGLVDSVPVPDGPERAQNTRHAAPDEPQRGPYAMGDAANRRTRQHERSEE